MAPQNGRLTIEPVTDPERLAAGRRQDEQFERNWAWLEAHASEVYSNRGKIVCIAGQELFVGDSVEEAFGAARAKHPQDLGVVTRIVPKERGPRIDAC